MAQTHFDNIQQVIAQQLDAAQHEILTAVAYFTDKQLYLTLMQAMRRGVRVVLLLADDDINHQSALDYDAMAAAGCAFYWYQGQLMHHKFCLIDEKTIIFGSYNWTYKAAHYNRESIIVEDDDEEMLRSFGDEFDNMIANAVLHPKSTKPYTPKQNERQAAQHIAALRADIAATEADIANLEEEKMQCEALVARFDNLTSMHLGTQLLEIRLLEMQIAARKAQLSDKDEDHRQAAHKQREYDAMQATQARQKAQIPPPELPADEDVTLKRLYREAMMKAHPDRYANQPEKQAEALAIAQRLAAAREQNDLETVREIWQALQDETAFASDIAQSNDAEKLQKYLDKLLQRKADLAAQLHAMKQMQSYTLMAQHDDLDTYFEEMKRRLDIKIQSLQHELAQWVRR